MTENNQSKLTTVHATGLPSCKANPDPHSVSEVNQSEPLSLAGEVAWWERQLPGKCDDRGGIPRSHRKCGGRLLSQNMGDRVGGFLGLGDWLA